MSSNNATSEIGSFLESCIPSLANLEQSFISAGVTTRADVLAISGWDRQQIKDYFTNDFHKGGDRPDREPLKAFPAYVLFMRLADDKCVCATMRTPPSPLQLSTNDDEAIARLLAALKIGHSPSPVDTADDSEIAWVLSVSLNTTSPSTPLPRTPPPLPHTPPLPPRTPAAQPPPYSSPRTFISHDTHSPSIYSFCTLTVQGTTPHWSIAGTATRNVPRAHVVAMRSPRKKKPPAAAYVVFCGLRCRVFGTWAETQALVTGVPNCIFHGYPSLHAVHAAFNYAQEQSWTRVCTNPAAEPITALPQPMTSD
ncbi:hypothetical protein DFH08DRAFT_814384 [Mycena albidolilacea]|uniref:Ribonuclease H1 N-terminal domain-containing protein n=1 Tax=Mycena albidolilacea TaxID=1033008 RepID=A0AAD6ZP60_9AGAR|nr:hypothetical protein DFH08DRAFT_814384 [Mycena albidolilacea]